MDMHKKYIVTVLIPALLIQLYGCYSMQDIPKDEMVELMENGDLTVQTKDSTIYFFEESNYHISNDTLYGKGYVKFSQNADFKVETENTIALTNIESVQQDEINPVTTSLLVIGSILFAAFVGIIVLYATADWD
jgi:hypothetical protein